MWVGPDQYHRVTKMRSVALINAELVVNIIYPSILSLRTVQRCGDNGDGAMISTLCARTDTCTARTMGLSLV